MKIITACIIILLLGANSKEQGFFIRPGQGYSSVTEDIAETRCFNPQSITSSSFQSMFQYDSHLTTTDIYKMLKIDYAIKAGFGPFKAKATYSYLKTKEESELSFTVHYFSKIWRELHIDYPFQVNDALTEEGKIILAYGPTEFRTYCGDKFVTSYEEGATLIYSLTFTFSKKSEKKLIESSLSANILFASASFTYTNLFQQKQVQGTLSISAHQIGGDPTQLGKALANPTECAFNNLDACKPTLDSLNNYSQEFFQQIDIGTLETEPLGTLDVLGPYTTSPHAFSNNQIDLGESPVTLDIMKAREYLKMKLKYFKEDLDNLLMLKKQGFEKVATGIQENIENTKFNIQLLQNGLRYGSMSGCWYDLDYCIKITNELEQNFLPFTFDPKTMNLCNDPVKDGFDAHSMCKKTRRYKNSGVWVEGDYTDEIRIPTKEGQCYAYAKGMFKKKRFLRRSKRWFGQCAQISYAPRPDPNNEYDWTKNRIELVFNKENLEGKI